MIRFYFPLENKKDFFLTPHPEPKLRPIDKKELFMNDHLD